MRLPSSLRWSAAVLMACAVAPAVLARDNPQGESSAERLRKSLDQPRDLDIADQPLPAALNQLRDQTKINFVLDTNTLMQMGMDPAQFTVNVKLKNVKLRSGLRTMLSPYHLAFAILGDTVLVSTEDMAISRQLRQRVSLDLEKTALSKALHQLARETATNVLLDAKAAKEGDLALTLQLDEVPLETAVRLLAEMAGLKPVRVGNVLYVTTKANANELRNDPDLAPNPNGNPGGVPGMPVPPGVMLPGVGGPALAPPGPVPAADVPVTGGPPPEKQARDDKPPAEEKKKDDKPGKPPEKNTEPPPDKPRQ